MNSCKRWLCSLLVLCIMLIGMAAQGQAADMERLKSEYQKTSVDYLLALVCLATYSDRVGDTARYALAETGWKMWSHKAMFPKVDSKIYLMENAEIKPGEKSYILAITGTESKQDVKLDLDFTKVYFGGSTPDEFSKNAQRRHLVSSQPMVHRGFNEYVQSAFFTRENDGTMLGEYLANDLKANPDKKLYLVGHSLGGAVATIGAARFMAMGVPASQLEVVTFGAPAVGNTAFARQYGDSIQLRRITMDKDIVKGILQSVSGGYTQFGMEEKWHRYDANDDISHYMIYYLDAAMHHYYDKREALADMGIRTADHIDERKGTPMVYVSPVEFTVPQGLESEKYYMEESSQLVLRHTLPGYILAAGKCGTVSQELVRAKSAGCEYLMMVDIEVSRLKNNRRALFYEQRTERIYRVSDGSIMGMYQRSGSSELMTTLELAVFQGLQMQDDRRQALQIIHDK